MYGIKYALNQNCFIHWYKNITDIHKEIISKRFCYNISNFRQLSVIELPHKHFVIFHRNMKSKKTNEKLQDIIW